MNKDKDIRKTLRNAYSVLITTNTKYGTDSTEAKQARDIYLDIKRMRDEIEKAGNSNA